MQVAYKLKDIKKAALKIFELSNGKKVWALHGEMGTGKTTFVHALCDNFGVTSAVASPTYAIINEYQYMDGVIYHMDWYRLKGEEEAIQAGVEDCIISKNLCLIEWPERAVALLPDDCFHLHIKLVDSETREISVM